MAPPSLIADPLRRGPADALQTTFGLKSWGKNMVAGSSQSADTANASAPLALRSRDLSKGGIAGVSVGSIVGFSIVFFIAYPFVARTVRLGWNRWQKSRSKAKTRDSSPPPSSEGVPPLALPGTDAEAAPEDGARHSAQSSHSPNDTSKDSRNSNDSAPQEQTRSLATQLNNDEPAPRPEDEPSNAPVDYSNNTASGLSASYWSLNVPSSAFGLQQSETTGPQDPGMFEIRAAGDDEPPRKSSTLLSTVRKFTQGLFSGNDTSGDHGNDGPIVSQNLSESPSLANANERSRSLGANGNNDFQNSGTIDPSTIVGPGGLTENEHVWRYNIGLDQNPGVSNSDSGVSAAAAAAAAKAQAEADAVAELMAVAQRQGISIDSLNLGSISVENGNMSLSGLDTCGVDQPSVAAPAAYNSNSGGFGNNPNTGYSGPNSALAEGYSTSLQQQSAQPSQWAPSCDTHPQGVDASGPGALALATTNYDVEASNSLVPPSSNGNAFPSPISMMTAPSPDAFSEELLNTTKPPQSNLTSSTQHPHLQYLQHLQLQQSQAGLLNQQQQPATTSAATANLDLTSYIQQGQLQQQQQSRQSLLEVPNQPQPQPQNQSQSQSQLWNQQQQAPASSAAPQSEFLPSPPQANGDQYMEPLYAQLYNPRFILEQPGYQSFVDMNNNMGPDSSALLYSQPRMSSSYGQASQNMMMGNMGMGPLPSDFDLADFMQPHQPAQPQIPYANGHRYTTSNTSTDYHAGFSSPYNLTSPVAPSIANTPETHISATPSPRRLPLHDMTSPYAAYMPQPSPVAAALKCEECGRTFDQAHKLNHHKRYHERPHECMHDNCGKRFGTKTHLERHINDKHKQTRKYHCTEQGCAYSRAGGKGFPRKDNWRRHMSNIHGCSPGANIQADVVDESDKM